MTILPPGVSTDRPAQPKAMNGWRKANHAAASTRTEVFPKRLAEAVGWLVARVQALVL